jgi:hypothetical protein
MTTEHLFHQMDDTGASKIAGRRYDPAGFRRGQIQAHRTGGADYPFLLMTREA